MASRGLRCTSFGVTALTLYLVIHTKRVKLVEGYSARHTRHEDDREQQQNIERIQSMRLLMRLSDVFRSWRGFDTPRCRTYGASNWARKEEGKAGRFIV